MANIIIFGGTGYSGGHIATEAVARGHHVIAVSRHAATDPIDGVTYRQGSIHDAGFADEVASKADTIVIAIRAANPGEPPLLDAIPHICGRACAQGARVGVVGGAGSLHVAEGGVLCGDAPGFPDFARAEYLGQSAVLAYLRATAPEVDYFYVSPSLEYGAHAPGSARGRYSIGSDILLVDSSGRSAISGPDFGMAFVDEIEKPAHRRTRFTVGYTD